MRLVGSSAQKPANTTMLLSDLVLAFTLYLLFVKPAVSSCCCQAAAQLTDVMIILTQLIRITCHCRSVTNNATNSAISATAGSASTKTRVEELKAQTPNTLYTKQTSRPTLHKAIKQLACIFIMCIMHLAPRSCGRIAPFCRSMTNAVVHLDGQTQAVRGSLGISSSSSHKQQLCFNVSPVAVVAMVAILCRRLRLI